MMQWHCTIFAQFSHPKHCNFNCIFMSYCSPPLMLVCLCCHLQQITVLSAAGMRRHGLLCKTACGSSKQRAPQKATAGITYNSSRYHALPDQCLVCVLVYQQHEMYNLTRGLVDATDGLNQWKAAGNQHSRCKSLV